MSPFRLVNPALMLSEDLPLWPLTPANYYTSRDGKFDDTTPAQMESAIAAYAGASSHKTLALFFHGGLVNKTTELRNAATLIGPYSKADDTGGTPGGNAYPYFFVWVHELAPVFRLRRVRGSDDDTPIVGMERFSAAGRHSNPGPFRRSMRLQTSLTAFPILLCGPRPPPAPQLAAGAPRAITAAFPRTHKRWRACVICSGPERSTTGRPQVPRGQRWIPPQRRCTHRSRKAGTERDQIRPAVL
jgi:hypothetical protein